MTDGCPNIKQHTKSPSGYMQHHDWAEQMSKTHKVSRCPDCLRYVIWTPKEK